MKMIDTMTSVEIFLVVAWGYVVPALFLILSEAFLGHSDKNRLTRKIREVKFFPIVNCLLASILLTMFVASGLFALLLLLRNLKKKKDGTD